MGRVTAFSLILFYVALNLSLYFVQATGVLPDVSLPPVDTPTIIVNMLITGLITMGIGSVMAFLFQNWIFGAAGLVLWALQFMLGQNNIVYWAFYGLPAFINSFAASSSLTSAQLTIFTNIVLALTSVVWFFFIMSLLTRGAISDESL